MRHNRDSFFDKIGEFTEGLNAIGVLLLIFGGILYGLYLFAKWVSMRSDIWIFVIFVIIIIVVLIIVYRKNSECDKYRSIAGTAEKRIKSAEEDAERRIKSAEKEFDAKIKYKELKFQERENNINKLISGEDCLFGKIPSAVADLRTLDYQCAANYLEYKKRPAISSAEVIRKEYRDKAKEAVKEATIAKYKLEALLYSNPHLEKYIEDERGIKELFKSEDLGSTRDLVRDYLSVDEWQKLSSTERNQLALDRYVNGRKKDSWGIGKEYEMSCAYVYENKGFGVERYGVEKRCEDLGRDIIAIWDKGESSYYVNKIAEAKKRLDKANKATSNSSDIDVYEDEMKAIAQEKQAAQAELDYWMHVRRKKAIALFGENIVEVVQCKYWSSTKEIYENVVMQLYGTTIAYVIENSLKKENVVPVLMIPSFALLSDTAQKFIEILGVVVVRQDLVDYPRIKCNINGDNKIYHLPFDQQYDRTKINKEGEFYAWTVKEAEDKGFRRAMRHFVTNG